MGRTAQSAWILRLFVAVLCTLAPLHARAGTVTAQGVALNAAAGCSFGDLDVTLTSFGAARDAWRATNLSGAISLPGEEPRAVPTFTGTDHFVIPFLVGQAPNTLIGSYVYIGSTPPSAGDTAEFFVYYRCATPPQVLLTCFGPYGTCPQTAQQAAALLASRIPASGAWSLVLTVLLVGVAGTFALRRRRG
jgi:hypothetical protein